MKIKIFTLKLNKKLIKERIEDVMDLYFHTSIKDWKRSNEKENPNEYEIEIIINKKEGKK